MTVPLSTTARRFVRLARQEIAASRALALKTLGAPNFKEIANVLFSRLETYGPTRRTAEVRKLSSLLHRIPGITVGQTDTDKKREIEIIAVLPMMSGHPLIKAAQEEPDTIAFEGLRIAQRNRHLSIEGPHVYGCLTQHCVGRLAERIPSLDPQLMPHILRLASTASLALNNRFKPQERGITLRVAAGEKSIYLVGTTREGFQRILSLPGGPEETSYHTLIYADWRTALYGSWLSPAERLFGDMLTEVCLDKQQHDILPLLPVRKDYLS
jgi:hypothetical protein